MYSTIYICIVSEYIYSGMRTHIVRTVCIKALVRHYQGTAVAKTLRLNTASVVP